MRVSKRICVANVHEVVSRSSCISAVSAMCARHRRSIDEHRRTGADTNARTVRVWVLGLIAVYAVTKIERSCLSLRAGLFSPFNWIPSSSPYESVRQHYTSRHVIKLLYLKEIARQRRGKCKNHRETMVVERRQGRTRSLRLRKLNSRGRHRCISYARVRYVVLRVIFRTNKYKFFVSVEVRSSRKFWRCLWDFFNTTTPRVSVPRVVVLVVKKKVIVKITKKNCKDNKPREWILRSGDITNLTKPLNPWLIQHTLLCFRMVFYFLKVYHLVFGAVEFRPCLRHVRNAVFNAVFSLVKRV